MTIGFSADQDFSPIIGWTLYQVVIDKFHVIFLFNDGRDFLDVANKFSYRSADGKLSFTFDIYGDAKSIVVDRILLKSISSWKVASKDELVLFFENDDQISVYDNPKLRSWWFIGGPIDAGQVQSNGLCLSDLEYDDLSQAQIDKRLG